MEIRRPIDGEARDTTVNIRVSQREKAELKKLASAVGVSVGCYLLGLALGDQVAKAWTNNADKPDARQMKMDGV